MELADLYAIGFDPVSDRRNFHDRFNPSRYDQQVEEGHASATAGFSAELQFEMDRLADCDVLILQFPIWWLGMPAIMKGWIDRVFAIGVTYGGGRWFDRGMMRGKLAMLAVTIGGTKGAYSTDGIYGPAADVLRPINHGILAFCGFDVVEPYLAFAPARKDESERHNSMPTRIVYSRSTQHLGCLWFVQMIMRISSASRWQRPCYETSFCGRRQLADLAEALIATLWVHFRYRKHATSALEVSRTHCENVTCEILSCRC